LQKLLLLPRIGVMREAKKNREWDLKKLILAFFILVGILILILFFKFYFFANSESIPKIAGIQEKRVKGISTEDVQKAVQEKVDLIKQQADEINITDVASSSPQVQKLIQDIKTLENYPGSQARSMCENLCKSL